EVLLHGANTAHTQNLLGVNRTNVQLLAQLDVVAILNQKGRTLQHGVRDRLVAVIGRQDDLAAALGVLNRETPCGLRDRASTLRGTSLEQFGDARQTLRDVIS